MYPISIYCMSNYNFDLDGKILKISLERINDLKKLDQKFNNF